MRAMRKRPGEAWEVIEVENELKPLQQAVGGYPGAGTTKKFLEDKLEREQQQAMMAQQMQLQQMAMQAAQQQAAAGGGQLPQGLEQAVDERARQDALAAVQGGATTGSGM